MRPLALLALVFACSPGEGGEEAKPASPQPAAAPASSSAPADVDTDALRDEARAKVKAFGGALKGELLAAMKAGGPVEAIGVCNTRAPALAEAASADGWTVARRSDRLRNPANAADEWEAKRLAEFARRLGEGEAPASIDYGEIVERDGARVFRYAKPIPLGGECLACHGSSLKPEVAAALDARYPNDAARGYAAGELRGMFSLRKAL